MARDQQTDRPTDRPSCDGDKRLKFVKAVVTPRREKQIAQHASTKAGYLRADSLVVCDVSRVDHLGWLVGLITVAVPVEPDRAGVEELGARGQVPASKGRV